MLSPLLLGGIDRTPTKLTTVNPHTVHDHGQLTGQGDLGPLVASVLPDLEPPDFERAEPTSSRRAKRLSLKDSFSLRLHLAHL